jgi:hypothetical protein
MTPSERLAAWEEVRGMWKDQKPDSMKELKKIRKERGRRLPGTDHQSVYARGSKK